MTTRPDTTGKLPLTDLGELKRRGEKIVMVTAYDYPSGRLADLAGIDMVLVGDSAAQIVLGHDSTVPVTLDEMIVLARAAARGAARPLVVADLPFGSYQVSDEEAVRASVRFVKEAGVDAVKLEGAGPTLARVRAIAGAGVPVMGHIGLTPQSATMLGGYRAQGRTAAQGAGAARRRARARAGRLLRDRARVHPGRGVGADHGGAGRPDDRNRRRRRRRRTGARLPRHAGPLRGPLAALREALCGARQRGA